LPAGIRARLDASVAEAERVAAGDDARKEALVASREPVVAGVQHPRGLVEGASATVERDDAKASPLTVLEIVDEARAPACVADEGRAVVDIVARRAAHGVPRDSAGVVRIEACLDDEAIGERFGRLGAVAGVDRCGAARDGLVAPVVGDDAVVVSAAVGEVPFVEALELRTVEATVEAAIAVDLVAAGAVRRVPGHHARRCRVQRRADTERERFARRAHRAVGAVDGDALRDDRVAGTVERAHVVGVVDAFAKVSE